MASRRTAKRGARCREERVELSRGARRTGPLWGLVCEWSSGGSYSRRCGVAGTDAMGVPGSGWMCSHAHWGREALSDRAETTHRPFRRVPPVDSRGGVGRGVGRGHGEAALASMRRRQSICSIRPVIRRRAPHCGQDVTSSPDRRRTSSSQRSGGAGATASSRTPRSRRQSSIRCRRTEFASSP